MIKYVLFIITYHFFIDNNTGKSFDFFAFFEFTSLSTMVYIIGGFMNLKYFQKDKEK